jgi:aldose 1-epimerase
MPLPPSGRQVVLEDGSASVVVTEVGGGLRAFDVAGHAVLFGYDEAVMCTAGRGQVLAPWPNRLQDGSYSYGGVDAQAPIDEPSLHNAIHGLVRWLPFEVMVAERCSAELKAELAPQPGYPWRLQLVISYRLTGESLQVMARATNLSPAPAPFGIGFHPYLATGEGGVDACSLRLASTRRLICDDRALPVGSEPVAKGRYDFSASRSLKAMKLDDCFTGLGGAWNAEVTRGDGRVVEVSADAHFAYAMCFTADTLPPSERRSGVAIEPMTCAPNAFRSGEGLVHLLPDEPWEASWAISAMDGW